MATKIARPRVITVLDRENGTSELKVPQTVVQALSRTGHYKEGMIVSAQDARVIGDISAAFEFLDEKSKAARNQKPVNVESILCSMIECRFSGKELVFFTPWGPRYRIDSPEVDTSSQEMSTIRELREILGAFSGYGFKVRFLVMPADVYGTEINTLSEGFVGRYFDSLESALRKGVDGIEGVQLDVVRWSAIREANKTRYDAIRGGVELEVGSAIDSQGNSSNGTLRSSMNKAKAMNPGDWIRSGKAYIIERIAEATLIQEIYGANTIKVSLAVKENDILDGDLNRVYIVKNIAPWMSSELEGVLRR